MRSSNRVGVGVAAALLAALFLFGPALVGFGVDWLWFGELAQRGVFWKLFGARLFLGLAFGATLTLLVLANIVIARRVTPRLIPRAGAPEWFRTASVFAREGLTAVLALASVVLGCLGGAIAAARWDDWIRFTHAQPFGQLDPVFHQDLSFYIFKYPFLQFVNGWLFNTLLLVTLVTAVVYYLDGAVSVDENGARIAHPTRIHLSFLLGLLLLSKAWDYRLDQYGLLFSEHNLLLGAGYTDTHAHLPALNILMGVSVLAALGFFANMRVRALWLPALAVALMIVAGITVGQVYPGVVQRFTVAPNEQSQEKPYIQRHLDSTRAAYGLDQLVSHDYVPSRPLAQADLGAERDTLDNIRLWDYKLLSQAYQQLQQLRPYYTVEDVDVDRYTLKGKYRQVMLAARELLTNQEGDTWVNRKIQYTHGFGLVMSTVNETDPSGRPSWLVRDLPLVTPPELSLTRPQLYFGAREQLEVVAPSDTPEIDYPRESDNVTSRYQGPGGIALNSAWRRGLFSLVESDWNIFISNQVKTDSRILIRRKISERVAALAPFLRLDYDPYLVVLDGKLVWIQDAYTTANTYPYSARSLYSESRILVSGAEAQEPGEGGSFNYLRNSVKAVIDAYTGQVTLYAMDDADPLLKAYRDAFPGLFTPASAMSPGLRAHIRYPEGLFLTQAHRLLRFHVSSPDVFYQGSDTWDIPTERHKEPKQGERDDPTRMEPYYVIMRPPGQAKEEFLLILPFKPKDGTTMTGWLAAHCDGAQYGKLQLFRFPTDVQLDTPEQADRTIRADVKVSREITLLSQRGSGVSYGNFQVLPVGKSVLYVKPLFVSATQGEGQGATEIPVLKDVILAEKRGSEMKVVMQPTLRMALEDLVGGEVDTAGEAPPTPPGTSGAVPAPAVGAAQLAGEAEAAFDAADRALKAGNWAEYGKQVQRAREAVRQLRRNIRP